MASRHSLAKYRCWGQHPKNNVPKRQVRNLADIDEIKADDVIICPWCYQVIDLVEDEYHINQCMNNVMGDWGSYDLWEDDSWYFELQREDFYLEDKSQSDAIDPANFEDEGTYSWLNNVFEERFNEDMW